jgi:hypothetical protein
MLGAHLCAPPEEFHGTAEVGVVFAVSGCKGVAGAGAAFDSAYGFGERPGSHPLPSYGTCGGDRPLDDR